MLKIEGLTKAFASTSALNELSLTFETGKTTLLLGANGAGKSTLLRCIAGLSLYDQGSIRWHNQCIDAKLRRKIAFMPEEAIRAANVSCLEVVSTQVALFHPELSATDRLHKSLNALERVGLIQLEKKHLPYLSKGQVRRALWACLCAVDADLLLLDEPYSGLDPLGKEDFRLWLDEEHERGKTIVFSSHDLDTLPTHCEEIIVLKKGRCHQVMKNQDLNRLELLKVLG